MQANNDSPSFSVSLLAVALLFSANSERRSSPPQNGSQQQSPSGGVMIDPSAGPLQAE